MIEMENEAMFGWCYTIYGLQMVTNRPIPGLLPAPETFDAISIQFTEVEHRQSVADDILLYESPGLASDGNPYLAVYKSLESQAETSLRLCYTNGQGYADFTIDPQGRQVQVTWTAGIDFIDIVAYLLGPVIGCLLNWQGYSCLHAGVIAIGNEAIAIIGPKGAGKSTLTAYFAYAGYPVLADDIAVLIADDAEQRNKKERTTFLVQPGYPRLRLWPTTVRFLPELAVEQLSHVLTIAEKRYLDLEVEDLSKPWRFQSKPLPLTAVYALDATAADEVLSISPLSRERAIFTLSTNSYPSYTIDLAIRARNLAVFAQLTRSVFVRTVRRPIGLESVPNLCQAIVDDFHLSKVD